MEKTTWIGGLGRHLSARKRAESHHKLRIDLLSHADLELRACTMRVDMHNVRNQNVKEATLLVTDTVSMYNEHCVYDV